MSKSGPRTVDEAAAEPGVSYRWLQDFLKTIPACWLQCGRKETLRRRRPSPDPRGHAMPYTLHPPKAGRSPYWRLRGTEFGIPISRSTKTADKRKRQPC
jgi:hypothetical protein